MRRNLDSLTNTVLYLNFQVHQHLVALDGTSTPLPIGVSQPVCSMRDPRPVRRTVEAMATDMQRIHEDIALLKTLLEDRTSELFVPQRGATTTS
jgi:hypothetical protein